MTAMRDDGFKDDGLGDERLRMVQEILANACRTLYWMQYQQTNTGVERVPSPSPVDPAFEDLMQRLAAAYGYIGNALDVLRGEGE